MYRKRNGSLGFSFTRFANAAVPNFFDDPTITTTDALRPQRMDMLYMHQLASTNPYNLDERSIVVGGITENESNSKKIYKALQKIDVLSPEGAVDTTKIGSRFLHQVPILDQRRQKDLINLLFWWEEECHRLRKLFSEAAELDRMVDEAEKSILSAEQGQGCGEDTASREMRDQLKFARERVKLKIRQRPSQRRQDLETDTDNLADAFYGRASGAPAETAVGAEGGRAVHRNEDPPKYYA